MRKSLKVALWLIIIGIILCIIGAVGGTNINISDIALKLKDNTNNSIRKNIVGDNISELEIYIQSGNIKIVDGDEFKVEGNANKNGYLKIEEKNGKLVIKEKELFKSWFGGNDEKLTIYIPKGHLFSDVKIEVGACKIEINNIDVSNEFDLDIGAGDALLNNIDCKSIKLDCGAGQIKGSFVAKEKIDIDCGMGNVDVDVLGSKNEYNYDLDVGLGNLTIGDITINGAGDKKIKNTEENRLIKVDCGMGNVNIKFSE